MPEPTSTTTQDPNLTNNQTQSQQQGGTPATWEDALKGLPENVKALYEDHVTGLKNTVKATRDERKALEDQIKELSKKAEKGSELEKSLNEFSSKLAIAEQRAAFFEDAAKPEIGCRNARLAWTLAQAENLFTRNGAPDWAQIKAAAPELFGTQAVQGNAGSGTQKPPENVNMNDVIRRAAGRS